jgi:ubiquinone/menaquinone biosynthesis C-methylase UbiE
MLAEELAFADGEFDAVVAVHAIEHIPPLDEAAAEMARVLKPGGKALFIYPAEPIQGLYAVPTSVILYGTPLKAQEVHCHWLSPAKVRRIMEPHGLVEAHHEFNLLKSPQFISVFTKNGRPR